MPVVKMKQTRSPIVSVEVRKVDPREFEARNLIMWLKTLPVRAIHNPMSHVINLYNDRMRAVDCLVRLADANFDVTVAGVSFDFLRLFSDPGTNRFSVCFMEYMKATDEDDEHYSALCTQEYAHVVDAFKSFQFRIESEFPFKPS